MGVLEVSANTLPNVRGVRSIGNALISALRRRTDMAAAYVDAALAAPEACGPIAATYVPATFIAAPVLLRTRRRLKPNCKSLWKNAADNVHSTEVRTEMRYLKSPTFVLGVILLASSVVAMRPSFQADLDGFPNSSWDVMIPMRISLPSIGAMLAGVALLVASTIRLRSQKTQTHPTPHRLSSSAMTSCTVRRSVSVTVGLKCESQRKNPGVAFSNVSSVSMRTSEPSGRIT